MIKIRQKFANVWQRLGILRAHPVAASLCFAILLLLGSYMWFSRERPIYLSYSGPTCVNDLTFLPNFFKEKNSGTYSIKTQGNLLIHGYPVFSQKSCIEARKAPNENSKDKLSLAFLNASLLKKNFKVLAGSHPRLNSAEVGKTISVKEPLIFELNKSDKLFTYHLEAGDKKTACQIALDKVICPVEELSLQQGSNYVLNLQKSFENEMVASVAQHEVQTVTPVNIVASSLKEIIYDTPAEFKLIADKSLEQADIKLLQVVGAEKKEVEQSSVVAGTEITVKPAQPLPRETNYEIVVANATATDKGVLSAPYAIGFKMSGGPKVASVSIGASSVDPGASITITFDQPLAPGQNLANLISLTNGATPLAYTLVVKDQRVTLRPSQRLPICSRLQLQLSGSITSIYGITGDAPWRHSSRVICHTITTIGHSTQGRPIQAWRFGSGASKILYLGATHGNEKSTKYLLDRWITELNTYPERIPAHRTLIIIPNLNPDGFAAGSRRNANNVDLNRNFPVSNWKSDVTMPGGELVVKGAGSEPASEPETKALVNFVQSEGLRLVLTYHSVASIVSPNGAGDSSALAATYSRLSRYRNVPPTQTSDVFHYDLTGAFEDWLLEKAGLSAVLIELGSHTNHEFERNREAMWAMATL